MTTDAYLHSRRVTLVEIEICEVTDKRCFSSWRSADRHRIFVIRQGIDQRRAGEYLQSYPCRHCGRRHLGHAPRRTVRRRPEVRDHRTIITRRWDAWWNHHDDDDQAA